MSSDTPKTALEEATDWVRWAFEGCDEWNQLPLQSSLHNYIVQGHPVGGFLYAVLSNDFRGATCRADGTNRRFLWEYAITLGRYPTGSFGSEEAVRLWQNSGGLVGLVHRSRREHEQKMLEIRETLSETTDDSDSDDEGHQLDTHRHR